MRIKETQSLNSKFIKTYINTLPTEDLTNIIYFPKNILLDIDSSILRQQYTEVIHYYKSIYNELFKKEESPYS